jgi:hypothetical protein
MPAIPMDKLNALLRRGLDRLRSFRRKSEDKVEADEAAPTELADTVVDADAAAAVPAEDAEAKPSLWSRLIARFRKRETSAADEAAIEGQEAETESEGEEQVPGRWQRLLARFSLRKKAAEESEGELPDSDRAEPRGGADKAAGGREGARSGAVEEWAEEQSAHGRLRGLLARKPVWISLVVLAVAGISVAGWFGGNAFRAHSEADARTLQQRNQSLAEQNRKLLAENAKLAQAKNKPHAAATGREAAADPMGQLVAGNALSAGKSDEGCTVKDAASVRDTLKGCIEGFNAESGR